MSHTASLLTPDKVAAESSFIGQEGINFIERKVLAMRHKWQQTDAFSDMGIDGYIELCRDVDGRRVGTNFIIQVQSRATDNAWQQENEIGFIFRVSERDLRYWLAGDHQVILVVSRPRTDEAYWISIKEYFGSLEAKKTRTIYFKKSLHRFDENVNLSLEQLAIPRDVPIDSQPQAKREIIEINLLPLLQHPPRIYVARTRFRKGNRLRARAQKIGVYPGRSWFLKRGKVFAFFPFDRLPWPKLIARGRYEEFSAKDWADSNHIDKERDFVRLLNEALAEFLASRDLMRVRFKRDSVHYYFLPDGKGIERTVTWGESNTPRNVVQSVTAKSDPSRILCYRHHALIPHFAKYGRQWFLIVEPTYYFTTDGRNAYLLREDYLAGMKRLERNLAVRNNVRFWIHWLTHQDLVSPRKENLIFGGPEVFASDYGINDSDWLSKADVDERDTVGNASEDREALVIDDDQLALI
jgi:hypothetical protein